MTETPREPSRNAKDLSRIAQDAAYVAIGFGVLGFQRAQVARRELTAELDRRRSAGSRDELRSQVKRAWTQLDRAVGELIAEVDTTIEPVAERLGEPAQSVVKQAQELRDQLRSYLNDQLVA